MESECCGAELLGGDLELGGICARCKEWAEGYDEDEEEEGELS